MTNQQLKTMANRIKERREQLGFTQEQFAETIEISSSSYTKIENAFQKPSLDTLIAISEKLKLSLDYLVYGGEKPRSENNDEVLQAIIEFCDKDKLLHAKEVINKLIKIK